ncbi:MAG TPA: ABC transporter permease [Bryobacteraceae bacterium]|jgi:predicted permease
MSLWSRLRGTFLPRQSGSNIQQELEFHIEQRADELIEEGHTPEDALRLARLEFGNSSKWREETRDADIFIVLENWLRDTRQTLRGLRRRPIFALTAIASLAIGIGAVASLFSVADAVVWKPIALPHEHDLYILDEARRGVPSGSNGKRLADWQTLSSLAAATGWYGDTLVWRGPSGNEAVRSMRTYTGIMATAEPPIAIGRGFTKEEEGGTEAIALATHQFWRTRLNSGPLGPIELSGKTYQIVGVLAPSIGYPDAMDLWIPAPAGMQNGTRVASYLSLIVRLKPDTPPATAQAEINLAATRLSHAYPKTDANLSASLASLRERISRESRTSLFALLAVVVCVLAMICVNIAALLLARGSERESESALRSALGASRASLIRLYWIEALLLSLSGGALGITLAFAGVNILKQVLPAGLPRLSDAHIDARVLLFALGVSLLAALASGLIPAWLASRKTGLHDATRGASAKAGSKRLRTAFVVVEIALSALLVTTGVRLGQAFLELTSRPIGFRTADVLAVTVPFPWTVNEDRLHAFTTRALDEFRTLPGVTDVGVTDQYPLLGGTQTRDVRVQGITTGTPIHTSMHVASPGYFNVMNVRLLEGRMFDIRNKVEEYVVNEAFARRYFTDGRPASAQRLAFGTSNAWSDVVGVVSNLPQDAADETPEPEIFTYYANDYWPYLNFAFQTSTPAAVLAPLIRQRVAKLDGTVIVKSIEPMREKIKEGTKDERIRSTLVGSFALLALLLMAIGIHGLIASDVSARWREFGIRLALGATVPSLRLLLIAKIAALAAIGFAAGITAVLLTSNLLTASFAGLPPIRTATIAAVCAAIAIASLTAILWPLYRIARIHPAAALRHE